MSDNTRTSFDQIDASKGDGQWRRLHYVIGGDCPPLILLHGWPQRWREWRHVMSAMAKQLTVIAVDLRGFGDSEKPLPEADYDVGTHCSDLAGLLDRLDIRTAHVAGHDLGGLVARDALWPPWENTVSQSRMSCSWLTSHSSVGSTST